MNKATVVIGEASETESEEEPLPSETSGHNVYSSTVQATSVSGEDSESEIGQADDTELTQEHHKPTKLNTIVYNSLLHKKLREENANSFSNLEIFCNNMLAEGLTTLNGIDQNMVQSEVILQTSITTLKTQHSTSLAFKNKLNSMISADFLPNVKVIQCELKK